MEEDEAPAHGGSLFGQSSMSADLSKKFGVRTSKGSETNEMIDSQEVLKKAKQMFDKQKKLEQIKKESNIIEKEEN